MDFSAFDHVLYYIEWLTMAVCSVIGRASIRFCTGRFTDNFGPRSRSAKSESRSSQSPNSRSPTFVESFDATEWLEDGLKKDKWLFLTDSGMVLWLYITCTLTFITDWNIFRLIMVPGVCLRLINSWIKPLGKYDVNYSIKYV